ncbi:MAG: Mfa1 fimbrilin C-terminal domain-containing protein, partial [Alistipes sp.]|nr:Mfa1 fimbrilin C-terminal domain-containing protein [Alistipes sp.]
LDNGVYKPVANNLTDDQTSTKALNAALKGVASAVLYTEGYTFYYVDIKHLGAKGKDAEFGIVRNHAYNITINSIKGYGSPVYEGTQFVDYPTTPEQNTYVSAKISILSWRLVNQVVDIQPQN